MKKNELRNKTNLIKEYLYSEKLIINKTFLFNIDFNPDYNYTDYGRDIAQIYYFHGEKDFSNIFSNIISHSNITPHIFSQYEKPSFLQNDLFEITPTELSIIEESEYPTRFDSFEFKTGNLYAIDNINKTLNYDFTCNTEGGFLGDDFIDLYFEVDLNGITKEINNKDLYNQLIVDSYRKYLDKDYIMAFFLMFSAFECFINSKSGKPDEEKKLIQKKNELFRAKFSILNDNQINSAVDFVKFEKKRNIIAHGRESLIITKELVDDIYFDFISLILSYKMNFLSFDELKSIYEQYN